MPNARIFSLDSVHHYRPMSLLGHPETPAWVYVLPGNAAAYITFALAARATSYIIISSNGLFTVDGTAQPIVVPGLTNDVPTTISVRAINSYGASLADAISKSFTPTSSPTMRWGTLGGQQYASTQASKDVNAGLTLGMFELGWNSYQPTNSSTQSASYVSSMQTSLSQMQAAGLQLSLSLGAHNEPAWITGDNSLKFVSQDSIKSTNLNAVFLASGRLLWQQYVDRINNDFGLNSFRAIRITSVAYGEFLYPNAPSTKYFAFDTAAQTGSGLASGQTVCPYPGWIPGGTDTSISTTAVGIWADWYLQSLVNCADWQMQYLRSKGYTGIFEILMPGQGTNPAGYTNAVNAYLPGNITLCVGAAWDKIYPKLAALSNASSIWAHLSSIGDSSGTVPDDIPQPSDINVAITDPIAAGWSATRWGVRLANQYNFPLSGENVGYTSGNATHYADTSDSGMMYNALAQTIGGNLKTFYWAHDNKFADGTVKLANLIGDIGRLL